MFNVPPTSSPPATPNWRSRKSYDQSYTASNPSTTPAGPPPTSYSAASTTPTGPPPSSTFGSSRLNQPNFLSNSNLFTAIDYPSSPPHNAGGGSTNSHDVIDAMEEDGATHEWNLSHNGNRIESEKEEEDIFSSGTFNIRAIAKSLAIPATSLAEPDHIVLDTEDVIENVQSIIDSGEARTSQDTEYVFSQATDNLLHIWQSNSDASQPQEGGLGPSERASPFTKALFVSSLAYAINSPISADRKFSSSNHNSASKSIPEALITWLQKHHNPYPNDFRDCIGFKPNPTAHERFWDIILTLTLRGDLVKVVHLLKEADFREASTALEDGAAEPGYSGMQLSMAHKVVNRAISVFEFSPALLSNDWNTSNTDWIIFRKRVMQALNDLESLTKGPNSVDEQPEIQAAHFGLQGAVNNPQSMTKRLQKAESKVPWSIYNNLKYLYDQLLGNTDELMAASSDWLEATIGLTIWWDGESDMSGHKNLSISRASLSKPHASRSIDVNPRKMYQNRLRSAFRHVTAENDDSELQVNTMSAIQVGLASIFEQDLPGLVSVLRGWSAVIGSAVAEIASYGGWRGIVKSPSKKLLNKFDQSDLMVLNFGQQPDSGLDTDEIRLAYAELLSQSRKIGTFEGWQLSIRVLSRLNDTDSAQRRIKSLLENLDLTTVSRVENVVAVCVRLGLDEQARQIAENFADHLIASTDNYGDALYYYARARKSQKLKQVIDALVSASLIESAISPAASGLDATLSSFLFSPTESLTRINILDPEAASLISSHLSGYATLRKFYHARDHEQSKSVAATALTSTILSAADSIHGGLYDSSITSAISVENLLLLLGEALPFLNQPKRMFTSRQLFIIMKAVEDISSLSDTPIFSQSEARLKSAVASAYGSDVPSPRAMLKKSISNVTASSGSQFSLIADSSHDIMAQSEAEGSGILISTRKNDIRRAWDWRVGLPLSVSGNDIIRILRLGLARELARLWTMNE